MLNVQQQMKNLVGGFLGKHVPAVRCIFFAWFVGKLLQVRKKQKRMPLPSGLGIRILTRV